MFGSWKTVFEAWSTSVCGDWICFWVCAFWFFYFASFLQVFFLMGVFWIVAARLCKWLCCVYLQPMKLFSYFVLFMFLAFLCVSTGRCLCALFYQITHCFCYAIRYYSTSTLRLSECFVIAPVSLRPHPEKPSVHWLVSFHRPEQAPPSVFPRQLCLLARGYGWLYICDITTIWKVLAARLKAQFLSTDCVNYSVEYGVFGCFNCIYLEPSLAL